MAENWLTGDRNYKAGLEILRAAGASNFIIKLLEPGPDAFNTPKLLSEIKKLQAKKPVPVGPIVEERTAAPIKEPEQPYVPNPNLEKKLRVDCKIKQLWKEICHLHGQLCVLPAGDKLKSVAFELMKKNLRRQDLWDHLHYFNLNGEWFDDLPENQIKPFELEQEIKNLMANRSKASGNLKKPLPAGKKQFYQEKVDRLTVQIAKLKKMRNGG